MGSLGTRRRDDGTTFNPERHNTQRNRKTDRETDRRYYYNNI